MSGNFSARQAIRDALKYLGRTSPLQPEEMRGLFSPHAFAAKYDCWKPSGSGRSSTFIDYTLIRMLSKYHGTPLRTILTLAPDRFCSLVRNNLSALPRPDDGKLNIFVGMAVLHNAWNNREDWFTAPHPGDPSPLSSLFSLYGIKEFTLTVASLCTPQEWIRYGGGEAMLARYDNHALVEYLLINQRGFAREARFIALGMPAGNGYFWCDKYSGKLDREVMQPIPGLAQGDICPDRAFVGGAQLIGDLIASFSGLRNAQSIFADNANQIFDGISKSMTESLMQCIGWGGRESFLVPLRPLPPGHDTVTPLDIMARLITDMSKIVMRKQIFIQGVRVKQKMVPVLAGAKREFLLSAIATVATLHHDLLMEPVNLTDGKKGLLADVIARGMAAYGRIMMERGVEMPAEPCNSIALAIEKKLLSGGGAALARIGTVMNRGRIAEGIRFSFPGVATAAETSRAILLSRQDGEQYYEDHNIR